jgi:hypothetical protein
MVDCTHVIFEPLDFLARLAALVPKPRVNLTRFHGVFAPNSKYRIQVTPSKRGKASSRFLLVASWSILIESGPDASLVSSTPMP